MYADAIEALKQYIRLKPDMPEVHLRLGILYSMQDTASALKEYEILKNLDPDSANELYKIIQTKKNNASEAAVLSADVAKEKIPQQEAADAPPKRTLSAAVSAPPQKNDLPSQTAEASVKEASSDEIDSPEDNSRPEATRKIELTSEEDIYSVQLGLFNNKENALSLSRRLKLKGYDVFIKTEYRDDQTVRYRVLVGRFSDKTEVLKISKVILNKEKLKSIIFKH
jgi:cell division septation protein DedD